MSSGDLLFFNAIPLEDEILEEVRAWGRPAHLVVPHHQHMIDAHAFREKLGLKLFGPKECEREICARAELEGTLEAIPADANVTVQAVPGVKLGEPAIIVRSGGGTRTSLLFGDVIQNNPKSSTKFVFRMMGFAGGPKVVPVFKMMFMKDKPRMKDQLVAWSELPGLTRLVPCHGEIVSTEASGALRAAADAV